MNTSDKPNKLGRNTAIYGGALLLPRLSAFVALIIFSRLLSPAAYGYFALFVISAELVNAVLFNWIRLAFLRFHAEYENSGRTDIVRTTCLAMTGLAMALSVPIAALMAIIAVREHWTFFLLAIVGMTFANGVVRLRLTILQAQQRAFRYLGIEAARASLSLVLSLVAVETAGPNFEALSAGFVIANIGVALICLVPFLRDLTCLAFDRTLAKTIISYAAPIVPIAMLGALFPFAERYIIQFVTGPAAVGIYAASQNLVQQPINMLASALALAAFPIVMRSADIEGLQATQARMREVAGLLLALLLPAVAGIVMLRVEIVSIVLGEEFRTDAIMLMPWVAATAAMTNLKYHYVDMAFHITRRMWLQVMTLLPAILLTPPLIYVFIKIWGLEGAAAGACLAFFPSLLCGWLVSRFLIPIPHAFSDIARIVAAVGVMIAVLSAIGPLSGFIGLFLLIAAGGLTYALAAVALNVMESRTALAEWWARIPIRPVRVS